MFDSHQRFDDGSMADGDSYLGKRQREKIRRARVCVSLNAVSTQK